MNKEESRTELGSIRIYKSVISSIAATAAIESEGVKRIAGGFKSEILELIGKKSTSSIRVEFDKTEDIRLEIPLIIKYGYNIPQIANKVQQNVRGALEKMTNLSIKDININVQGIERG